jgi:hypothetical protein
VDTASRSLRPVRAFLAFVSLGSVIAVTLLMPTLLTALLAMATLLGVLFALLRNSRRAALIIDIILLTLLLASHLLPYPQRTSMGPLDIVRLILILSFHEFSSIYSDARGFEPSYPSISSGEGEPTNQSMVRVAMVHRTLWVSGFLLAAAVVSEAYFLAAQGTSASLYSIYGVAAGLMTVIVFLFLVITIAARKPEN